MIYSYLIPAGGYAANSNIVAHSDSVMGDWAFQYDTLNRLAVAAPALNAAASYQKTVGCYNYDGFGNRTIAAFSTSSDCTKTTTATASYNSVNQVTFVSQAAPIATSAPSGFTYDAAGDVVADANNSYAYDGEGRLCAVYTSLTGSKTQYVYDASGGRVAKASFTGTFPAKNTVCAAPGAAAGFTLTAQYLLDQGGDQVTELNGSGAWQHSNVWAGAHLDATYDAKGLHFHLADPLGTRRIQTNIDGAVEESCQSLPFGDNLSCTTTSLATADDATEHHFTGKEHDTESGNDYFDARYYSSTMGRFMSPDWSAQEEPIPYAKLDDPQSLNLYSYALNNPLIIIDTDGHELTVAPGLQAAVTQMRQESVSYNEELSAYEGPNSRNLVIGFGSTPDDPSGLPSIGNTNVPLQVDLTVPLDFYDPNTGALLSGSNDDGYSYSLQSNATITITINDSIRNDVGLVKEVLRHETGHAHDARTDTNRFGHDRQHTRETHGSQNHDDRQEEKKANEFKQQVEGEMRKWEAEQRKREKDEKKKKNQ
jgi:RHS repeat-associated protein